MKSLLILLIGVMLGATGYHYLAHRAPPANAGGLDPRTTAERAKAGAREVGGQISHKLADWNLTPENIREELNKSGRIIRQKAQVAGARIDDARIVSVIKAKYVLDEHLRAMDINVDCRDGHVQLRGQAASDESIGHAVALALETDGVVEVDAQLTVTLPAAPAPAE